MTFLKLVVFICIVLFISVCKTDNLQLGNLTNAQLAYVENVKLSSIPLKTRTKNVFYNDENTTPKVIKAISVIDLDQGQAKASVTAGGVGSTFVNVRLKSERGEGLNYQVQIFV